MIKNGNYTLFKPRRKNATEGTVVFLTLALTLLEFTGCGKLPSNDITGQTGQAPIPLSTRVVKARSLITVTAGSASTNSTQALTTGTVPVSTTLSPSTSMTVDSTGWVTPAMSNSLLNFGNLKISAMNDNNLKVCGNSGNQKCGTASITMYTTGTPGAGFWNAADAYGVPIYAGLPGATSSSLGLNLAGGAVVQSFAIPPSMHNLRLADFPVPPTYVVTSDFTNAGAGSYSTTIVLEYALSP